MSPNIDPTAAAVALETVLAVGISGFSLFCIWIACRFIGETIQGAASRWRKGPNA